MKWSTKPTEEGWYFWRSSKAVKDPAKWVPYYVTNLDEEEGNALVALKDERVEFWPKGGEWARIEMC